METTIEQPPVNNAPKSEETPDFLSAMHNILETGVKPKPDVKQTDEPAKEPEKPPAATQQEEDIPSEIKSEKAKEGWRELKRSREEDRKKLEQAESKLEALEKKLAERASPQVPEELTRRLAELEKERDDYSERLRITDVEKHPKFQKYFGEKSAQLTEAAKAIVGAEYAAQIERVMKTNDPEMRTELLEALMPELSASRQARLGAILTNLEMLNQERNAEIGNAKQRWEQLQAQSKADEQATFEARNKQADYLLAAAEKLEAFTAEEGADASRTSEIAAFKDFVRGAVTGKISAEDAQMLPLAAVQGLYFKTKVVPQLQAQVKELQERIKQYEGAKPRGGTGTGSDSQPQGKDFLSIVAGRS